MNGEFIGGNTLTADAESVRTVTRKIQRIRVAHTMVRAACTMLAPSAFFEASLG